MSKHPDDKFWSLTERFEEEFNADFDAALFRRRMKRLGHPDNVIAERIADIHPHLAQDPHQ